MLVSLAALAQLSAPLRLSLKAISMLLMRTLASNAALAQMLAPLKLPLLTN